MRIRATEQLKVESFPDQKAWIPKLLGPINSFFGDVISILNDGIVFPDNWVGKDHVFKFTYQSDAITFPQAIKWTLNPKPLALYVASATEDGSPIIAAISWKYTTEGQIELSRVVRIDATPSVQLLQATKKYEIRVRVTP